MVMRSEASGGVRLSGNLGRCTSKETAINGDLRDYYLTCTVLVANI